jgi:adenosylmethionine-8-amino-7-oxononanoate aminotransferase
MLVRAEGAWLWDSAGKRYLDLAGSAAVNFIGHGHPAIGKAIAEQLQQIEFAHSSQFHTPVAEDFAHEILEFAGPSFAGGAVFFTSGGSETVESALKLARQYQVEIGQAQRTEILSRKQAYHGATFGAMSVSGNPKRKQIYLPMLKSWEQVNTPYCYRCAYPSGDCAGQYAQEVESVLEKSGSNFAAFIFEPVSGATLGAAVPPDGYLRRVTKACAAHGVLTIADEVMTGFGRTGRNFAVEHWGVHPDIIVAAKGIASGYAPLGAVIATRKVVDSIANGSGSLVHGLTYNAHPVACAAGQAVLREIRQKGLVQRAASDDSPSHAGSQMKAALDSLTACRTVGDVRGIGLLWGVEFVASKSTKQPFPPSRQFAASVASAAARRGVMTYPMQGCVDGSSGDHLLLAPPAIIKEDEIAWAVQELKSATEEVENTEATHK